MNENLRLPDAELFIMKIIWRQEGGVTSAQIMEEIGDDRKWAVTTVLNFLSRLVDREFLSVLKNGKINVYTAIVDEDKYLARESQSFLKRLHGGSFTGLVASLYDGDAISDDDLAELRAFIDEKAGEGR
ncbi:MAG: BlaI/MecI/CopY family transcriptional regulator [Defluviitaleaceae bacterium]|nr:BlaI/MecI/CopY family transcriptional regulator [Defluviitaleaceae bacterium]